MAVKKERELREKAMLKRKKVLLDNGQLEVGMELAEPLYNQQGLFVLKKGVILNEKMISGLVLMDIKNIPVWQEIPLEEGEKFKVFQNLYQKADTLVNDYFNEIKVTGIVDKKKALKATQEIFQTFVNHEDIIKYMNQTKEYNHALNVTLIIYMFTQWLNFTPGTAQELIFTALIHDIGKMFLKEGDSEAQHTIIGEKFMMQQGSSKSVCLGIRMHHSYEEDAAVVAEWWAIHPFAKIIAIADFYDHATNREGTLLQKLNPFKFIVTLGNSYYGKFDIRYMELFLSKVAKAYTGHKVELSDGRKGTIIFINPNALSRPIVQTDDGIVDLYLENKVDIIDVD